MDNRHYENKYEDYPNASSSSKVVVNTNEITEEFQETLRMHTKRLLTTLEERKKQWLSNDDYSVYTGSAGIAYMYYHYGKNFNDPGYISKALELLKTCVSKFRGKREITFLTGIAGPLALSAVIYHEQGNQEESQSMMDRLKSLVPYVLEEDSDLPDELLYGRAGYLYCLLFVNSNITPPPIEDDVMRQIVSLIIKNGNLYASLRKYKTPLMYAWHESEYIGGAHGLGGIIYMLLQARKYLTQTQLQNDIKPALQYLQELRYPSGNFPSSVGSHTDKLVHWCHGAPGMSMLFCTAYEMFQDEQYLKTALQCGEVVWKRGLLKKGYSICHGVSGNAYTFLCLFQQTKDLNHLYRACKFAEWCFDYGTCQIRNPDRPYSLFEGLAGTLFFLIDLHRPYSAKFPAYSI